MDDTTSEDRDFNFDDSRSPPVWRLTERGNERVATFLHMHVCRSLAQDESLCSFLPPETYQGKVFIPDSASLDRHMEKSRERKLKELFWGG